MKKRTLSLLLAAAMTLSLLTTGALATGTTETLTEGAATISLTGVLSTEIKTVVIDGESKEITIYKIPKSGSTLTVKWNVNIGMFDIEAGASVYEPGTDGAYSGTNTLCGGMNGGTWDMNYDTFASKLTSNSLICAGAMQLEMYFQFDGSAAGTPTAPVATPPAEQGTTDTPATPATPAAQGDITYTVQYGDTLAAISFNNYGVYNSSRLYKANSAAFKESKGILLAGMVLTLPEKLGNATRLAPQALAEGESFYTVKAGDSLSKIALKTYGDMMEYKAIYQRNADRIKNANTIYVGQVIILPAKAAAPMLAERG